MKFLFLSSDFGRLQQQRKGKTLILPAYDCCSFDIEKMAIAQR